MLVKQIQKKTASLLSFLKHSASINKPNDTPISKHNPDRELDYRGHHNLDQLQQIQRDSSPLHTNKQHYASAYFLSSLLPNVVAKCIGKLAKDPKSTLASDCLHLPKIYPEGVPVYDSLSSVNNYLIINKVTTMFAPAVILAAVPEPTVSLLLYTFGFSVYYFFNWRMVKNLVIKTEFLPNTEEIVYQKITIWGRIHTKKVRVQDLEPVKIDQLFGDDSKTERNVRGLINKEVAFRVKSTQEYLFFDKNGIWYQQGIDHPLLV